MKVVLYTTHCPQCEVLEKKLKQKNIIFEEINDITEIRKTGYLTVPLLEVNGNVMNFKAAIDWVNSI